MVSSPITSCKQKGERLKQWQSSTYWALKSLQMVTAAMKWEDNCCLVGKLCSVLKSKDITLLTKVYVVKAVFSSSHVWMRELDDKDGREPKNWCFLSVVLEKTLESPLENKEIKPVNLKGNQPWILFERTDDEAEAPILWLPDVHWKSPWCW